VTPCSLAEIYRCSSEISVKFYQTTRCHIPEYGGTHDNRRVQGTEMNYESVLHNNVTFSLWMFYNLPIYGCTALVHLGDFFNFLIYTQSVGLLGRGISPSQGRYLHTEQHKHRIKAHIRQLLEWESNPRSQRSSGRRRLML
jgi:hypothetical protein